MAASGRSVQIRKSKIWRPEILKILMSKNRSATEKSLRICCCTVLEELLGVHAALQ